MSRFSIALQLAGLIMLIGGISASAADEVMVENGKLQGTSNEDHSVRMFKGIPFAAPPVGDLRWKAPQPAANWNGVRQADKFGSACLQTDVFGDCVVLWRRIRGRQWIGATL
jgi:para-nitrobenzyl esterase